ANGSNCGAHSDDERADDTNPKDPRTAGIGDQPFFWKQSERLDTRRIKFTANSYPADNDCQMRLRQPGVRKTELRLAGWPSDREWARARRAASLTPDLPASPPLPRPRIAGDGSRPGRPVRCNKRRIPPGSPSFGYSSANLPA